MAIRVPRLTAWLSAGVLLAIFGGCNLDVKVELPQATDSRNPSKAQQSSTPATVPATATLPATAPFAPPMLGASADRIKVASFNIQVLGQSKISKPDVVSVLVDTIRQFDVIAIQELRSKDQSVIPRLVDSLNSSGRHFDYLVGPRLGRTSSKEQYVFLFDRQRIELIPDSAFTVPDPDDFLHREPFVAQFRVRTQPPEMGFRFALANIHTDPDDTVIELDALADAFVDVQRRVAPEDDVIMLGDLNVSQENLGKLGRLPSITWTVKGVPTNTRRTKSYDNILFHQLATAEYQGRSGIFDFWQVLGLTEETVLRVSDHLPVWAEFGI